MRVPILSNWPRIPITSSSPALSAARPAISTSRISRTSKSSHRALGRTRSKTPKVSRTACVLPPLTTAPLPCSMRMRPRASRTFNASRTTVRLTPSLPTSSRSGGSRSPGLNPPEMTMSRS